MGRISRWTLRARRQGRAHVGDDPAKPRFHLTAFFGKALRPKIHGYYSNATGRDASIERIRASRNARQLATAQRRAERNAPHTLELGAVLYSSWGYEQTNVDFYEVVAVRGRVVDIRKLATRDITREDMSGTCVPVPGSYVSEINAGKRPSSCNTIRIASFAIARPWDGRPMRWTGYA